MKRLFFLLWPGLLLGYGALAQPADPMPALRRTLALARTDTARGRLLWQLSEVCEGSDSSVYFARRAVPLLEGALPAAPRPAERQRLRRLLGGALNNLGTGYFDGGHPEAAMRFLQRAARLRGQVGDVRGQVESLYNLAFVCDAQGDYAQALRYYQLGLRTGERVPAARTPVAQCLAGMASVYGHLGDKEAQLRVLLQTVPLLEVGGEPLPLLRSLSGVANAYLFDRNDTARAEAYARRTQRLAARTPGASDVHAFALMVRGQVRLRQHRLPAARRLLAEARRLAVSNHLVTRVADIEYKLAAVEEAAGNLPLALRHVRQGATAPRSNPFRQRDGEQIQARIYEKTGQPQQALTHYRRYIGLRDTIRSEESKRAGFRQQLGYEYDRKTARLQAAQAQRQAVAAAEIRRQKLLRYATLGGALLLLLLAGGLYNRFRFQRRATAAIAHEKERSDELLRNILPAEVAEELKDTGKTTARHFERVTVLFADVVGFTQLSETLSPQLLVATLDTYFGAFDAITGRFGLEKIKTIGDAYMLAGGLGQGDAADPAAVVRAALAMHAAVAALQAERQPLGLPCFTLRIGLHTGPVVAGVVGVKKFAYDIWGDTVNTAARMETSGTAGKVNISESTHALVADRFACTPRGRLAAKHKGEIEMFFVEEERPAIS